MQRHLRNYTKMKFSLMNRTRSHMDNEDLILPKKGKTVLLHVMAWLFYAAFLYVTNVLTRPEITIFLTILYLIPFCITFYISVYCLNLYKEKGIWWSIATFFIVFIVMATLGYGYLYFLLPYKLKFAWNCVIIQETILTKFKIP